MCRWISWQRWKRTLNWAFFFCVKQPPKWTAYIQLDTSPDAMSADITDTLQEYLFFDATIVAQNSVSLCAIFEDC